MRKPCSSARSCSSDSACSSGVGASAANSSRNVAAVDVQADVLARAPRVQPAVSAPRENGIGAREKYRAKPCAVDHDLHDVRDSASSAGSSMRAAERAHRDRPVGRQRGERLGDHLGLHQRLVALHVDDDVAVERRGHLRQRGRCRCDGRPASSRRRPPNASTASRTRSSSVATITASTAGDAARGGTRARSSAGRRCRPAALPGRRDDWYRAGMMATCRAPASVSVCLRSRSGCTANHSTPRRATI